MTSNNQPLKIDKNVPLPPAKSGSRARKQHLHDALDIMEVGDSVVFAVDGMNKRTKEPYSNEANTFQKIASRKYGFKMSRRLSEDRQTFRYWRIG
jgi:hypothetical protein